ncbi:MULTISPECIES: TIGR04197 family type VII secretion effector [Lacticaseibacillus]|uniref:TIGR04197 family type VII secretion effector n=2 Tax=Lacticaseibacillus TaxID=2759736 RepID=A0AAN1F007_LACCA|nr:MULTISPECIES: TIGR04197 family type VII secretion effector [Lacticaseibacillus]ARY92241.1 hypothetical protein BGL52_10945 [Lacticaseibacillus casei]KAB1971291.1 TIGR04197 family type VII secretion effector [Lacticaseibacillus casei]WLV80149.1 TIGR04197 family type VII secretion effector [Lacticaseibacillus sp. NCIMB 15473]WNX24108.1 TIGR04197 family type VII secretion effector [Lacticaseibacillus casei]WNX26882.1 TIGR04197 family type VII secretion effector [Lacticaseibacillus casei]
MSEIGVKIGSISSNIANANSDVAGISKLAPVRFSGTDLKPFTDVESLITKLGSELSKYKALAKTDTQTFQRAANQFVEADSSIASFNKKSIGGL